MTVTEKRTPRPHQVKAHLSDEQLELLQRVAELTGEQHSIASAFRTLLTVYGPRYIESVSR